MERQTRPQPGRARPRWPSIRPYAALEPAATIQISSSWHSERVSEYEIVIHLRQPGEPLRILLPGVGGDAAEQDRQKLKYEIEEARLAEVPILALQTSSGHPVESLAVNPLEVTEVDLIEVPVDDPPGASAR